MDLISTLRIAGTLALAALTAYFFDHATQRRRLDPPAFALPWRRGLAAATLAILFWVGVYSPLLVLGTGQQIDPEQLSVSGLFIMQILMALVLLVWFALGWSPPLDWRSMAAHLGLRSRRPWEDVVVGVGSGLIGWAGSLALMVLVVAAYGSLAGQEAIPQQQPELIRWLVGLPILVRLAISLSAGVVEEAFFRGFLQPRAGIAFSSFLFVIAHAGYDQPFMLVGLTFLSLFLAFLVKWRQSLWPAIIAHFLFDAVQLLIVIPLAVRNSPL